MRKYLHTMISRNALVFCILLFLVVPLSVLAEDLVFTPLTGIPGVETVATADSLTNFLNALYRICVGIAAVLAVIQITRAGIMYMLQDSFTKKEEAKHLIQMSVLGLVLVLSPTIVFGIIDPRILSLRISAEGLGFTPAAPIDTGTGSGTQSGTGSGQTGEQNGRDTQTDSQDVEGEPSADEEPSDDHVVSCGTGYIEEFNSDGTVGCVADPDADEPGPQQPSRQFQTVLPEGAVSYIRYTRATIMYSNSELQCNYKEVQSFENGVNEVVNQLEDEMQQCQASAGAGPGTTAIPCTAVRKEERIVKTYSIPDACPGMPGEIPAGS